MAHLKKWHFSSKVELYARFERDLSQPFNALGFQMVPMEKWIISKYAYKYKIRRLLIFFFGIFIIIFIMLFKRVGENINLFHVVNKVHADTFISYTWDHE